MSTEENYTLVSSATEPIRVRVVVDPDHQPSVVALVKAVSDHASTVYFDVEKQTGEDHLSRISKKLNDDLTVLNQHYDSPEATRRERKRVGPSPAQKLMLRQQEKKKKQLELLNEKASPKASPG